MEIFTPVPASIHIPRYSPGDLSLELPATEPTPVEPAIAASQKAAHTWARTPLEERCACLRRANAALTGEKETLAQGIAIETGKPITEARGELGAVLAKFDLTIADAHEHLMPREVGDGPHPAQVRRLARGPAAVIAPFNFPLHLGNGALLAHLAAGNPVIFKPSPYAAAVAARYAALIAPHFPPGVFQLVQGGAEEAQVLCLDPRIRAVCFTGSIPVGRQIAKALAEDFSKELALELGGRNAAIICADADLGLAANAVAEALCLTCGQRCNATTRILVAQQVAEDFAARLLEALARYRPGDPLREETRLGPLISSAAVERYSAMLAETGDWLLAGQVVGEADGRRGHYVTPAIRRGAARLGAECFVPIADYETFADLDEAIARHNASPFGLTASVFTREARTFRQLEDELPVGNLYANLPTTFSPSTLPFGGLGVSGNGRPGGRGFVRFCTVEQAIQLGKGTLAG
jgi:acyl-CoA reductase-like NAD-dependent aldehyde dehydrogenase